MIIATKYMRPNITIETELVGSKKFYIHNYKGVHYIVFDLLKNLRDFVASGRESWIFDCVTENELEKYLQCVSTVCE